MSSTTRNILFLASWYPNVDEPQNGNFIERHAQAVAQFERVAVLYVHSRKEVADYDIQITQNGAITECIVYYPKSPRFFPFLKIQRYKKAHRLGYQALVKQLGPFDLTHLNVFFPAGIFAMELKNKFDIPFIITEHWTKFLAINPTPFTTYEHHVIRKTAGAAAMICPVSEDLKKAMVEMGLPGPYQVVPNVVDTTLFGIRKARKSGDPIRLLHISTLNDAHKNTTGILRVIKKLSEQRQDFTLTMIGNLYGDRYIEMAKELGIPAGVIDILPEIPLTEVAKKMVEHDIFFMFSNYENLPCVISEALVCGLPVVASNVGGINEMIEASNGVLVAKGDEDGLLGALGEVMDGLDRYDSEIISEKARERYGYGAVGRVFGEIYSEILS